MSGGHQTRCATHPPQGLPSRWAFEIGGPHVSREAVEAALSSLRACFLPDAGNPTRTQELFLQALSHPSWSKYNAYWDADVAHVQVEGVGLGREVYRCAKWVSLQDVHCAVIHSNGEGEEAPEHVAALVSAADGRVNFAIDGMLTPSSYIEHWPTLEKMADIVADRFGIPIHEVTLPASISADDTRSVVEALWCRGLIPARMFWPGDDRIQAHAFWPDDARDEEQFPNGCKCWDEQWSYVNLENLFDELEQAAWESWVRQWTGPLAHWRDGEGKDGDQESLVDTAIQRALCNQLIQYGDIGVSYLVRTRDGQIRTVPDAGTTPLIARARAQMYVTYERSEEYIAATTLRHAPHTASLHVFAYHRRGHPVQFCLVENDARSLYEIVGSDDGGAFIDPAVRRSFIARPLCWDAPLGKHTFEHFDYGIQRLLRGMFGAPAARFYKRQLEELESRQNRVLQRWSNRSHDDWTFLREAWKTVANTAWRQIY